MKQRVVLVYQAGIANVFKVDTFALDNDGRNAVRVYQGDFHSAVMLCRGMELMGAAVKTAACNRAGDIAEADWSDNLEEQPFSDKFVVFGKDIRESRM